MKKIISLLLFFVAILAGNSYSQPVDSTTLSAANISGTVTLNAHTVYIMKGFNRVKSGGALVIQPGALIRGDKPSTGTLIVERGGKIYANGTVDKPITFTSRSGPGQRNPGDWGGVIILGRSGINTNTPTNIDSAQIEGLPAGQETWYGGQPIVNDDSSGVLRYVRIEYCGVALTPGNEINGLTMGGVGSKTVIEYVQVSYSGDDAYEFFGGNVNCKYLIAFGSIDDDLDCDNGHRGRIQFALVIRDSTKYDVSGSHNFEIDNNANNPSNFNTPRTRTIFSNVTAVGPNSYSQPLFPRNAHIRRNMQACIFNSIVMGYPVGVRFDGNGVCQASSGDTVRLRNTIFAGHTRLADSAGGCNAITPTSWLQTGSFSNRVFGTNGAVMLTNPFNLYPLPPAPANNINFWVPQGGSPALTGASFSDPLLAGFEVTTYVGAFGSSGNWTEGWSNFNPFMYEPAPIGIKKISTEVPGEFSLSQNYPNPFNPSTTIKFSVAQNGLVNLAVFDVLGREAANVIKQNLQAGSYEVNFDASNLPSGVYFYKITLNATGSIKWTQTKKMVLVK